VPIFFAGWLDASEFRHYILHHEQENRPDHRAAYQCGEQADIRGKKKIFNIKDISLHPSEVHLLLVIENHTNTNATLIANQLGLTKGAVSQTISRLVKKGILEKSKDPYHKNELTLSLTALGQEAFAQCLASQAAFSQAQQGYLDQLDDQEKEVILGFLRHLESVLPE
jgi:DNA-binding MarR family transcriptional regulator